MTTARVPGTPRIPGIRLCVRMLLVAGLMAGLTTAVARAAKPRASLVTLEAQFMCTSCHEPLELAQSPQAISEKGFLKGLIDQGLTQHQIANQMVAQYGVAVLGKPPASGFNLTVYILPPAILLLGVGFLLYTLPKWRERSREAAVTPLPGASPLDAADAERLDEDLARFI